MNNCSKCGKVREIGMFSLVSDMCDDCYEKENFYKYDNIYIKEHITQPFDKTKQNILFSLIDAETIVHNKIKNIGKKRNMIFATVFREFDNLEIAKLNELKYSFFFSNSKWNLSPNYEDRKKEYSWLICIDTED